ncbi:hypothetical protein SNEBB_007819 [Seison nebaliae]|nr:hypothetical protein SNEBB_007819 [Seison nebaliae]
MHKLLPIICLLSVTISSVYSIQCYLCAPGTADCDLQGKKFRKSPLTYTTHCQGSCAKRWVKDPLTNKRQIMRTCDVPGCANITNHEVNTGLYIYETHCCQNKDFCNNSPTITKSVFLIISTVLLSMILRF